MSIENIKKRLKEESKPDTTWMPAAKKRAEEQKRVMFRFDNDEPVHLGFLDEGGEFNIKLREGNIVFNKDGKTFELYIENTSNL